MVARPQVRAPVGRGLSSGLLLRLHSAQGIQQFWVALQAVLREVAPYDALIVYLNFLDFSASWRAAKVLMTPNARRPHRWFEGRRRVDMTPEFVLSQPPGLKFYRLSDVVPNALELKRSAFFRNYLAPGGWHHLACQLYWRGNTVCSQIAIRRVQKQGDFTEQEVAALEELHPHIEAVLNRLLTVEEERARRRWLEDFNARLPFALLSLNWELDPVFANERAFEHCATWNYGSQDLRRYRTRAVFHVPAQILAACEQLKADWLAQRSKPENGRQERVTLTVAHPTEKGFAATVTLEMDHGCSTSKPGFLVHLHNEAAGRTSGLTPMRLLLDSLTHAERDLVRCVCQGASNREIASTLGKSVKTVKSQLTSIYRKLKVMSRARLLAEYAQLIDMKDPGI